MRGRTRKRRSNEAVPLSLREHRLSWLLKPIWHKSHNHNQMFSAVACAKPGRGKSWLTISLACDVDRSHADVDRFDIDRIYFSPREFAAGMAKKWPRGTAHIFDDVGISMFSREAMLQSVRDMAKIFQSVRYKNYILFLSLPALGMLDKVVRQLIDVYIEPIDIDYELQRTECKYHWLQANPAGIGDKIYQHRPETIVTDNHSYLNYPIVERKKLSSVWVDRPAEKITKEYEKKKRDYMDDYYYKVAAQIEARERKKTEVKESKYVKYYNLAKVDVDRFVEDNKVSPAAVLAEYPESGPTIAQMVAAVLTRELKRNAHSI